MQSIKFGCRFTLMLTMYTAMIPTKQVVVVLSSTNVNAKVNTDANSQAQQNDYPLLYLPNKCKCELMQPS